MRVRVSERAPISSWEVFIVGLSVYVLLGLAAETFFPLSHEVVTILGWIDGAICVVFLADFSVRFARAPDRLAFMKWGWIDLLSSIPTLDAFRAGRIFRLIRILRVLRGVRSARRMIEITFAHRAKSCAALAGLAAILLLITSAICVLHFEARDPSAAIRTGADALWWACTTITTVGYGDFAPVTAGGRAVGVVLMTAGVGLFGMLSGFLATWFIEGDQDPNNEVTLEKLKADLEEIKRLLQEKSSSGSGDREGGRVP